MQNKMEQKTKYTSSTAEKIVITIEEAMRKLKIVGRMSTLIQETDENALNDDSIEKARAQYEELKNEVDNFQQPAAKENEFSKLSDKMLFYLNEWSLLDWETPGLVNLEPSGSVSEFYTLFEEFLSIAINMLTRTAKELNAEQRFVEKCAKFLSKNAKIIAKLEKELPGIGTSTDQILKSKQEIVDETNENINLLSQLAEGEILMLRDNTQIRTEMIEERSEEIVQKLKEEENALQEEVNTIRVAGEKGHKGLRQRVHDLKMSILWIIDKYDQKMITLEHEFKDLWKVFSSELEKCRSLCLHYNNIKDVAQKLIDEKRKKFEAEIKERLHNRLRKRAAITIQSFWRGILAERKAKKLEKKEKTKEKKKKKKKK